MCQRADSTLASHKAGIEQLREENSQLLSRIEELESRQRSPGKTSADQLKPSEAVEDLPHRQR